MAWPATQVNGTGIPPSPPHRHAHPQLVGDEVTSLKFLRFLNLKSETPYVVSYLSIGVKLTQKGKILRARAGRKFHREQNGPFSRLFK